MYIPFSDNKKTPFFPCLAAVIFLGNTGDQLPKITIGSSAFAGCTGLTSIIIPGRASSIGGYAFASCTSLISVAIYANGIRTSDFGDRAFPEGPTGAGGNNLQLKYVYSSNPAGLFTREVNGTEWTRSALP